MELKKLLAEIDALYEQQKAQYNAITNYYQAATKLVKSNEHISIEIRGLHREVLKVKQGGQK